MPAGNVVYVVRTNLGPGELNRLTLEIFQEWIKFAEGDRALNGKSLKHPTGKYAASITMTKKNDLEYAIIADDSVPEAGILEVGHPRFDLKTKFEKGRLYPMHREDAGAGYRGEVTATGYTNYTGSASIGPNSTGWILPPMPAYSPAKIFAQLAREAVRQA